MSSRRYMHAVFGAVAMLGVCAGLSAPAQEKKGDPPKKAAPDKAYIYKDMPGKDEEDTRSKSELHFTPYLFMPESNAKLVNVNTKFPITDISPDEKGTCIEISVSDLRANDWAGPAFIPGDKLGAKPAYDFTNDIVVGFGRSVALKFRARTKAKETVRVRFECFGFADGDLRDAIRPTQTPNPDLSVLNDTWKDFSIDITKKAAGLNKVVSPLRVIVRQSENAKTNEVVVYLDDIRIELGK